MTEPDLRSPGDPDLVPRYLRRCRLTAQLQQLLEQRLDVPAAGVVPLNQHLELLCEVSAGLVQTIQSLPELRLDSFFKGCYVSKAETP